MKDLVDRQLKVLYYSHSGDVSGAEISLLLTVLHMKSVQKLLVAPEGELLQRARHEGISCVSLPSYQAKMVKNPVVLLKGILGTWAAARELRKVIRREEPDIVHANSIRAGLIAAISVWGSSTKLFWHIRDNLPKNIVGRAIRMVASIRADWLFVISNAIHSNFVSSRILSTKTTVVHNGIDLNSDGGISIRSELGVHDSCFVIAVVGQIAPWKRQDDAIQAHAEFVRYAPNSELWIVGAPKFRIENQDYEVQLKEYVNQFNLSENVRFLGFRSDVMNVMASIDVLLIPSDNEPFGRVIIEAMLAGKPVVGTNAGGVPEIVIEKRTGLLVNVGDTQAMTNALLQVYRDRNIAAKYGAEGRRRVLENFSVESMVSQIQQVYREHSARGVVI